MQALKKVEFGSGLNFTQIKEAVTFLVGLQLQIFIKMFNHAGSAPVTADFMRGRG
jgi:hypothetical protein